MNRLQAFAGGLLILLSFGFLKASVAQTAGVASSNQTICEGTQPAPLTLSGYSGSVQWQILTIQTGAWNNISGATSSILSSDKMGTLSSTTFYRAAVTDGNTAYSNMITITVQPLGLAVAPEVGNGTTIPYEITSFGHLRWIAENPSRWGYNYIQKANINASLTANGCYYDPEGWNPIGNSSVPFTGIYDGGGFKITGIYLNRPQSFQGLFGEVLDAELRNIKLNSVDINAKHGAGALAGKVSGTAVSNCHSTGVITVTESGTGWSNTGGLLGDVYSNDSTSSVIDGCSSTANVSGSMSALGGLVGVLGGDGACTIQNSFATGNVTITQSSGSRAGGLVGLVLNSSEITNCYARGSVSANAYAGGLVGLLTGIVYSSYSTGSVSGASDFGGLVGGTSTPASVNHSFWNTTTSGQANSAGGTGSTTSEMKAIAPYLSAGWDYQCETINGDDDTWGINATDNSGYPFLSWQGFIHDSNLSAGTVSVDQLVCDGAEIAPLVLSGFEGNIQWQFSVNNIDFEDIEGAVADSLDLSDSGITGQNWYRAMVSSGSCSVISDVVSIGIFTSSSNTIDTTACDIFAYHGAEYDSSGTYIQTLENFAGCDSVVTLNLTILNSSATALSATSCESYVLNDETYSTSGIYEQVLTNVAGCDSVVVLDLTILEATADTIYQTACNSYLAPNGQIATESGEYTLMYTNSAGCDSVVTLYLTIEDNNTVIETTSTMATLGFSNGSATVSVTGDQGPYSYQWNDPFMQTTATAIGVFPGTYICTITDGSGCQSQVQVIVPLVTGVPDTKVADAYCNNSGYNLSDFISCTPVANAELYRWEFVPQGGTQLVEYNRAGNPHIRLQWVDGIELATTYDVRVKARVDGQWGDYDAVCTITTAMTVPTTEIRPGYYPTNMKGVPYELCDMITAYSVSGAGNYRWKFDADGTVDNGNEIVYTRGSGNPTVRLSWIDGLVPNSEYQVSVEVLIGPDWSGYGAAHTILIGEVPAPVLRNGYCGATIAPNGYILSTSVCEADSYTFEFEPVGGGPVSVIHSAGYVAQLSNASPALSSGNYNVRVRAKQGGVTGEYGIPCEISIGGQGYQAESVPEFIQQRKISGDVKVGLYPNPNPGNDVRITLGGLEPGKHQMTILLHSIHGAEMMFEKFAHQGAVLNYVLPLGDISKGIYIVQVRADDKVVATERLVIR